MVLWSLSRDEIVCVCFYHEAVSFPLDSHSYLNQLPELDIGIVLTQGQQKLLGGSSPLLSTSLICSLIQ